MPDPTDAPPVVFIHGLWLHASSWQPWTTLFDDAGYTAIAPGWPGRPRHGRGGPADPDRHRRPRHRRGRRPLRRGDRASWAVQPILIGHSFGGMIAQKLLGQDLAVAAVAIDAAQIKGVLPLPLSALRATLPVFKNPANKHRAVSLTAEQFRYAFGNAISEEESDELHEPLDDPGAGQAAVRGRGGELQPALPGEGRHREPATAGRCC